MFAYITIRLIEEKGGNMWNICKMITVIFELIGFGLIWIGLIGFTVHCKKPRIFNTIFNLFFGIEDNEL